MNWLSGFKKATHAIAVAGGVAAAWAVSDKGQEVIGAVVHAYPKASAVTAIIGFLAVLYHSPKS